MKTNSWVRTVRDTPCCCCASAVHQEVAVDPDEFDVKGDLFFLWSLAANDKYFTLRCITIVTAEASRQSIHILDLRMHKSLISEQKVLYSLFSISLSLRGG
jgi:hypothetical protein